MAERLVNRAVRSETSFSEQFRRICFSRHRFLAPPRDHRENTDGPNHLPRINEISTRLFQPFFFSFPRSRIPLDINFFAQSPPRAGPLFLLSVSVPYTQHSIADRNLMKSFPLRFGWGGISAHCATPLTFLRSPSNENVRGSRRNCYWYNTGGAGASCILDPSPVVAFFSFFSFLFLFFSSLSNPARLSSFCSSGVIGHS